MKPIIIDIQRDFTIASRLECLNPKNISIPYIKDKHI